VTPETVRRLLEAQTAGPAIVLATRLPDGAQLLLPDEPAPPGVQDAASLALARDENRIAEVDGARWFLHVHAPPYRLVIVGAVHVAQALSRLAAVLGYGVTIVDPRRSFATEERFPGMALVHDWPDEALETLAPDARTAVVTLTHDPKLDDPALDRALRGQAFYIGALGSRKTHAGRLERLAALGHAAPSLARIRGPVGLALGAVSAPEIALSILADIVAVRRGAALARRD
jgi:xanthine dehydrogenase accessory factor